MSEPSDDDLLIEAQHISDATATLDVLLGILNDFPEVESSKWGPKALSLIEVLLADEGERKETE